MNSREKVIGFLQEMAEYFRECRSNASFASKAEIHFWELQNAANEVAELLKEQEAVKPVITPWAVNEDGEVEIAKRECGKCGWQFFTEKPNYCENCGAPILWEGR